VKPQPGIYRSACTQAGFHVRASAVFNGDAERQFGAIWEFIRSLPDTEDAAKD